MSPHRSGRAAIGFDRRTLLGAAAGGLLLPGILRADGSGDEEAEVRRIGTKAGLDGFGRDQTEHYLGLGNAQAAFRLEAIRASEAVADGFLRHFHQRGFPNLAMPKQRLTVVVLADAKAYAAYTGEATDSAVGGHYELDTNRLVMFDFRGGVVHLNANAERINSLVLTHETTHQLTFNTGLLDRKTDVPLCVIEGLATYGEVWRPRRAAEIGQVNFARREGLRLVVKGGRGWIPLADLLVEDALLDDLKTRDVAYAESWVLVHYFMKVPGKLDRFRAYLAAIKPGRDPRVRLAVAREHLGDLKALDEELRRYEKKPTGR